MAEATTDGFAVGDAERLHILLLSLVDIKAANPVSHQRVGGADGISRRLIITLALEIASHEIVLIF